jgi:hypothetical protein
MPASTYVGNSILDVYLRGTAPILPTQLWVALHTADPTVSGINEMPLTTWPSYQRQDAAVGGPLSEAFTVPGSKASANTKRMEFGVMDGPAPVVVTHFSLWDAVTGGQMYIYGTLIDAKTLAPTDECLINASKLQATVI